MFSADIMDDLDVTKWKFVRGINNAMHIATGLRHANALHSIWNKCNARRS